jgi:hypothetical protein
MRYEILGDDGAVINTVVADAGFMAAVYPGGNFRQAAQLPQPAKRAGLTQSEWYGRFTPAEQADWFSYVYHGLEPAGFNSAYRPALAVAWGRLQAALAGGGVDLDDPLTAAGLAAMEAAGLLAAGRAAEVLA